MTATKRRTRERVAEDVTGILSIADAAHELGIGTSTAYDLLRDGKFPTRVVTIGSRSKVLRADLDRYLSGDGVAGDD